MAQYLGKESVKNIVVLEDKTPNGAELSEVEFESGKKEVIPTFFLTQIITENPIETIDFVNNQMNIVSSALLSVLLEHNVRLADIGRLLDKMVMSVNQNLKNADAIHWGKNEEDKKMLDVHKLLIENKVTLKDILTS